MLTKGEPLYCPYLLFTLLYFLHVELKPSSLYITPLLLFIGVGRRLVPSMGCVRLGRKITTSRGSGRVKILLASRHWS